MILRIVEPEFPTPSERQAMTAPKENSNSRTSDSQIHNHTIPIHANNAASSLKGFQTTYYTININQTRDHMTTDPQTRSTTTKAPTPLNAATTRRPEKIKNTNSVTMRLKQPLTAPAIENSFKCELAFCLEVFLIKYW